MSVRDLIATASPSITTRIHAVLAGNFNENFIITDRDNIELDPNEIIEVIVPDFRQALYVAGLQPRGGGKFAFGGFSTIHGTFQFSSDSKYAMQMTMFSFMEIQRHRRPPIRVFPPIEFD